VTPQPTTAFATRVSARPARLVEEATEETDQSESDLLKAALLHYMRTNPDHIQAFRPERSLDELGAALTEDWPCSE
jgi:hypothetical protein